ncbi:hypothetical protein D9758_001667 [Tetrapyrgos nigripes]|uniref:Uncharacterized protein n=1 Tax=Tetrapyrgos nigripes TaxID=182062 RepID=A0A8H5GXK2_9AGAR|nr:hypothetical protein D9758_001667 [Tetrapyrgos nigripes]
MAETQPLLVAPRPVYGRTLVRFVSAPEPAEQQSAPSPKPSLPSEALEEFLSILRHRSPVRSRRQPSLSALSTIHQGHERSFFTHRPLDSNVIVDELERSTSRSLSRASQHSDLDVQADLKLLDIEDTPFRWFASSLLASPISRNGCNPFQRHATPSGARAISPALSPAKIPLPLPTPDEHECLE